jgi:hypothetical protein
MKYTAAILLGLATVDARRINKSVVAPDGV